MSVSFILLFYFFFQILKVKEHIFPHKTNPNKGSTASIDKNNERKWNSALKVECASVNPTSWIFYAYSFPT